MKIRKIILSVLLSVFLVFVGVMAGIMVQKSAIESANNSLLNIDKIAIVNLDEGVTYNGETRSFSSELISINSGNFTITNLEDARSGLEKGGYAGYIVIPADFSSNVISINTTPSASVLKYEVSGKLTQEASNTALLNIYNLRESINNDIGYMYLFSILSEYQKGQINAEQVLSNDDYIASVITALSETNLVVPLDMPTIKLLANNIEDLDLTTGLADVDTSTSTIETLFRGYLTNANVGFEDIKTDYLNIDTLVQDIETKLNAMPTFSISASEFTNLGQGIDDYNTNLTTTTAELTALVDDCVNSLPACDLLDIQQKIASIETVDKNSLLTVATSDVNSYYLTTDFNTKLTDLNSDITSFLTASGAHQVVIDSFDFTTYINQSEIDASMADLTDKVELLKSEVVDKGNEQKNYVNDVYTDISSQVGELATSVTEYKSSTEEKVSSSINNAKAIVDRNTSNSITLLDSYINSLKYLRNGESVKTQVAKFVLEPSVVTGSKANVKVNDSNMTNIVVYSVIILAGISSVAVAILNKRASKKS